MHVHAFFLPWRSLTERGPGRGCEDAASGSTRKALVHLSLLSKNMRWSAGLPTPTRSVPSRVIQPRRSASSRRGISTPGGISPPRRRLLVSPFQRRLGQRGQRIALATYGLTLPGPTPASHALGSTFPTQVGTSVTTSQPTVVRPRD